MVAGYLTILVAVMRMLGYMGPEPVQVTIDTVGPPPAQAPADNTDDMVNIGLLGTGVMALKGRRDASKPIGKWLGGDDDEE
jgi:hypothetical protein